ncbi:endonuclease/exonuclease/phosphatase family protein [Paenibacillus sp. P25]|nr:endonuclease/exonuclease/phosphatase family protein [Paenibacillus sp. P25]
MPVPNTNGDFRSLPIKSVLLLISLLLSVSLLLTVSGPFLAASAAAANPADGPRVMTYNIRHAEGLDGRVEPRRIVHDLQSSHADLIALQEVDRLKWRSGLQDQPRYFAKALGMQYAYAPAIRGGVSQYGVMLLSRYPLQAVHSRLLRGGREPRCLLTAQIRLGDRNVTVATTHLGVAAADRTKQSPQLLAALKSVHTPLVLLGDFNSASANPQLQRLTGELGLRELPLASPGPTVLGGGEIDHIFTNMAQVEEARTERSSASDHLPVVGRIML